MKIKFRAWDKNKKEMLYVFDLNSYGEVFIDYLTSDNDNKREFIDVVLQQSTGLFDKNGKEIFEGDIVEGEYEETPNNWKPYLSTVVEWEENEAGFNIRGWDRIEIIGNIYEDEKLIKK